MSASPAACRLGFLARASTLRRLRRNINRTDDPFRAARKEARKGRLLETIRREVSYRQPLPVLALRTFRHPDSSADFDVRTGARMFSIFGAALAGDGGLYGRARLPWPAPRNRYSMARESMRTYAAPILCEGPIVTSIGAASMLLGSRGRLLSSFIR